jgi:hypothetical protein
MKYQIPIINRRLRNGVVKELGAANIAASTSCQPAAKAGLRIAPKGLGHIT